MTEEKVIVKKHYLAKSSKGTPSIKIQAESCDIGETLYYDCWLTDATYKQTIKTLREALGWNGNNLNDLDGTGILVGKECIAVTEEEEYEGKTHKKIKFLNSLGGIASDLSIDEKEEIQNGFDKALEKYDNTEFPKEKNKEPITPNQDDLPF
jgi:hypothetical protein